MSSYLRRVAVALVLVGGIFGSETASSPIASATGIPTFGEPTVSGLQGNGFEQDLRIDPQGILYTSAPGSLSSGTSFLWRSLDSGKTFKLVPGAQQPTGKLPSCLGGGDTELATDSAGNLYFNDLTLANFSTARSGDHGTTFSPISCTGVPDTVVDRQWYAVDGNPTAGGNIFLAYDRVAQTAPVVCPDGIATSSTNNILVIARSPLPGGALAAGTQYAPSQNISCDEGIMGNDEFFNYSDHGKRIFVIHDNIAFSSVSIGRCDVVDFTVSLTGLANCVNRPIASFPNARTGGNFPTMSIDRAGHLFALWEQAPYNGTAITGNSVLMYSTSSDEGDTWTAPRQIPTPGLANNVFAWPAAGDAGRIDVAWYGTSASCDSTCVSRGGGPDYVDGNWGLYLTQTLTNGSSWTAPVLASKHFIHHGTIQTVMGGQNGDRTLGDFINLRIGRSGEANISYADSNNIDEAAAPQAMFVRQNGGPSVFASPGIVTGPAAPVGSVTDPSGDATFDNLGTRSPNLPNLDILGSQMTAPDSSHYRITMKVANLTSLAPSNLAGGPDLVWLTQWHVPSTTDVNGGKVFFVYMESLNGAAPVCFAGENAMEAEGGGVMLTYPGTTQLTGSACTYTKGAPGTITITVPRSEVSEVSPLSKTLYSVVTASMTLGQQASSVPPIAGIGGVPFNLIDVAPAYDFTPTS